MAMCLRAADRGELRMDKEHRRLLSAIAHEAHMMGRIYNRLDEKETPSEAYDQIEDMIEKKIKQHGKEN